MTASAATEITEIGLEFLIPSPDNARKSFDPDKLQELTESIRSQGILTPLIVRTSEAGGWADGVECEIVAGHRRYKAAKLAGLQTAPCLVRELTDAEARELGLIDNVQREDVGALEEAEGFGALYDLHGSIQAVAARVSKDVGYVAKRLRLRSLSLASCDALRERLITVDHALLLARLGSDEQDAALKWTLDTQAGVKTGVDAVIADRRELRKKQAARKNNWRTWEPESAMRLKEHIEQSTGRKLSRAPWDLDDAELIPNVGACSSCPSNTKANTALFSDLAIEEATCADGACFEAKREEYVLRRIKESRGKAQVLRLSWKSTSVKPATTFNDVDQPGMMATTANPAKVLRRGQWIEAKKGSCPNVRTGITVDWSDDANRGYMGGCEKLRKPGEALLVCIAVGCKAHPKAYEQKASTGTGKRDEAAQKAAEEKRKAEAIAESKLRLAVASKALEEITALPIEAVRVLAQRALPAYRGNRDAFNALIPGIMKILQTAPADSAEFARAVAAASIEANYLTANDWQPATFCRKEFLAEIKAAGLRRRGGVEAAESQGKESRKEGREQQGAQAESRGKKAHRRRREKALGAKKRQSEASQRQRRRSRRG